MQTAALGNDLALRLITEAVETGLSDLDVAAIALPLEEQADFPFQ